jgi:hypothetical protein
LGGLWGPLVTQDFNFDVRGSNLDLPWAPK